MSIVAPLSRYKKNSMIILIVVLVGLSGYCFYDANYNEKFIKKYTAEDGTQEFTLWINRKAPPYLLGAAVFVGIFFFLTKGKKVVADDTGLVIGSKIIDYEKIQAINKTHFDKKGFFIVKYKNAQGGESDLKLSDRTYDNLPAVLDELIKQIS